MNQTDRIVLDMIRRYSVKFGAAHLKHETIATNIGKSTVTVRRVLRKLAQLGIIERISYIRPVMSGLGANIYAILPFEDQSEMITRENAKKPCGNGIQEGKSTNEPLFSKSITTIDLKRTYPAEQSPTTLFIKMKALLSSTIGDDSIARRLFAVYRSQSLRMLKFSIYQDMGELFEDLAIQSLYITVQATKLKTIRNMAGYFDGVLRGLFDKSLFEDVFMEYSISF